MFKKEKQSRCCLSVRMIKKLAFLGQPKANFVVVNQYSSSMINSILKLWLGNIQSLMVPEKMYPRKRSKTAFCGQPLHMGKTNPSTKQGPKYLSNWRNIALIQFIQGFPYRDKKIKIKRQRWIEHSSIKSPQASYANP